MKHLALVLFSLMQLYTWGGALIDRDGQTEVIEFICSVAMTAAGALTLSLYLLKNVSWRLLMGCAFCHFLGLFLFGMVFCFSGESGAWMLFASLSGIRLFGPSIMSIFILVGIDGWCEVDG